MFRRERFSIDSSTLIHRFTLVQSFHRENVLNSTFTCFQICSVSPQRSIRYILVDASGAGTSSRDLRGTGRDRRHRLCWFTFITIRFRNISWPCPTRLFCIDICIVRSSFLVYQLVPEFDRSCSVSLYLRRRRIHWFKKTYHPFPIFFFGVRRFITYESLFFSLKKNSMSFVV